MYLISKKCVFKVTLDLDPIETEIPFGIIHLRLVLKFDAILYSHLADFLHLSS